MHYVHLHIFIYLVVYKCPANDEQTDWYFIRSDPDLGFLIGRIQILSKINRIRQYWGEDWIAGLPSMYSS